MMKTAGTSLNKQLIEHFGSRMHIVPEGLKMEEDNYGREELETDLQKVRNNLALIAGHPLRPYIDFGPLEHRMEWFTLLRQPEKRYVSHYLHDYKWSQEFSYPRYRNMKNDSIVEWEKVENCANYQTRFIAGEPNYDKAVDILENKFSWVAITEEYEAALYSFRQHFELDDFRFAVQQSNTSRAAKQKREAVLAEHQDFIAEMNQVDQRLYDYVARTIWPRFRVEPDQMTCPGPKSRLTSLVNMLRYQANRQLVYRTEKISLDNLIRFYQRWYR
jgi:hypothetical protein